MFTTLPTTAAMSCTVPVETPATTTAVNVSVMMIMARQLDRGARCTSKPSAAPLRDPTACRLRRVVSLGSPPSATSPALTPSASLTLVVSTTSSVFASPLRAPPVTRFRTSPSCTVHSTVGASAPASGSVLDTTAFSSLCTPCHSIAVAAPVRRVLRRPFPFAHTKGLSFLTACRGFGSHTPRTSDAGCAIDANDVPFQLQPAPLSGWFLLDRVYALEHRTYPIDFAPVSRPRFSGAYALILWSIPPRVLQRTAGFRLPERPTGRVGNAICMFACPKMDQSLQAEGSPQAQRGYPRTAV